jgi:protein arginine phosphatase
MTAIPLLSFRRLPFLSWHFDDCHSSLVISTTALPPLSFRRLPFLSCHFDDCKEEKSPRWRGKDFSLPLEMTGKRKKIQKMKGSTMPSVLFVCTANRFRSPLAAAIFKKSLEEKGVARSWQVGSAGTWATPGQPALPSVLEAARDLGLDLSGHRAARLDAGMLRSYDLILVMQASQKEALQSEFPALYEHIYLLSHVLERRTYDFPDVSGSEREVAEVSADLNTLLRHSQDGICVLATYLHNQRVNTALQHG